MGARHKRGYSPPGQVWVQFPPVYTKYIGKYALEVVMGKKKHELKEAEFESLLDKASQPLETEQKPDSKEA
jgi:hypothetical protein